MNKKVKHYIWRSEPNSCNECSNLNNKIYKDIADTPSLPLHPNCKCYLEPIYEENSTTENIKKKTPTSAKREQMRKNLAGVAKHESQNNPAAIGYDRVGGHSYGTYQIATKNGTMKSFMNYVKDKDPQYFERLQQAGGNEGAINKTKEFENEWKELAKEEDFALLQDDFILDTHVKPVHNLLKRNNLDIPIENEGMQYIISSASVQFGATNTKNMFVEAFKNKDINNMTEEEMIETISDVKCNSSRWFAGSTGAVQNSVNKRCLAEKEEALKRSKK